MILFLPEFTDKREDFDFEIVNFPFLDSDVPRFTSYGVYISQLIPFARGSIHFQHSQYIVNSETSYTRLSAS